MSARLILIAAVVTPLLAGAALAATSGAYAQLAASAGLTQQQAEGMTLDQLLEAKRLHEGNSTH
jgi:hypothetical protein